MSLWYFNLLDRASFSTWVLNQICPICGKYKRKLAYKSLMTSLVGWKSPGEFMCIKFKVLKISWCPKTISNPFQRSLLSCMPCMPLHLHTLPIIDTCVMHLHACTPMHLTHHYYAPVHLRTLCACTPLLTSKYLMCLILSCVVVSIVRYTLRH